MLEDIKKMVDGENIQEFPDGDINPMFMDHFEKVTCHAILTDFDWYEIDCIKKDMRAVMARLDRYSLAMQQRHREYQCALLSALEANQPKEKQNG